MAPPGVARTVYPVNPPVPPSTGADHDTVTRLSPAVTATPVGAPGSANGVTAFDAALATEVPSGPAATTVNVYAVPLVNPVTAQLVVDDVHVAPPGDAVTRYALTVSSAGALQETRARPPPAVADTAVGGAGGVRTSAGTGTSAVGAWSRRRADRRRSAPSSTRPWRTRRSCGRCRR